MARVVVHRVLRRRADIGRSFGRKSIPVLVSESAMTTSSDVMNPRVLVERLPAWSLIFQVKTFLLLTEGVMTVALMSFTS
jgi:hypothetical protein